MRGFNGDICRDFLGSIFTLADAGLSVGFCLQIVRDFVPPYPDRLGESPFDNQKRSPIPPKTAKNHFLKMWVGLRMSHPLHYALGVDWFFDRGLGGYKRDE